MATFLQLEEKMKSNATETKNSEKPEELIDEISSNLDKLHERFVETSTNLGYARDAIHAIRPIWERLGNASSTDPDVINLYDTNINFLQSLCNEVRLYQELALPITEFLNNTAGTVSTFISASGATDAFFGSSPEYQLSYYPVFPTPDQHTKYVERFIRFDESLGKIYQEIWEVLYGTRADPERAALYLVRQSFDHLFGKLAPDDDVRKSSYWRPKESGRPNQIWRDERIQYAASVHIKDQARSETILASSTHMLSVYKALNRAHERNNINRVAARMALEEMRTFLEDWANAVGL